MTAQRPSRRRFIKAASAAGVVGLAGCIGDDEPDVDPDTDPDTDPDPDEDPDEDPDDDPAEMDMRIGTSAGGTWDVGLAFERAVDQHSDIVNYSTIESPGYVGSTYRNAEGLFEGAIIDTNTMNKAQHDLDMFADDPVPNDVLPWQGFHGWPYSIYLMAREDADIETFDDMEGVDFYPAEPGYSTRATTMEVLEMPQVADITDSMNVLDMDVADAPGAIEEGRVDAMIAYGTPDAGNTGWVVEYDARVDVQYVEPTDDLIEAAEEFAGAGTSRIEADRMLWEQDIGTDEIFSWDLNVWFTFHPDAPNEAVRELTRIGYENVETIREAEDMYLARDEPATHGQGALDDYPWHPGAAEYFQEELDYWEDDWIVGENPGDYKA